MLDRSDATTRVAPIRDATTTTLFAPGESVVHGQPLLLTAIVDGEQPLRGSVRFRLAEGGLSIGAVPLTGGRAVVSIDSLPPGEHTILAAFLGNRPASESDPLTLSVRKCPTRFFGTLAPFHVVAGGSGEFTVFVESIAPGEAPPTGLVTFWRAGERLGETALAPSPGGGAAAMCRLPLQGAGPATIVARYDGDGGFLPPIQNDLEIALQIAESGPSLVPVLPEPA